MKASELRVGNIVYIPQTKTNEQIGCIEENGRFVIKGYKSSYSSIECLRPIPLTEEWLIKFGFTRHHTDYFNDVIFIKNVPNNNEFEWGVYPNEIGSGIQIKNRKPLKYVHQLQNLYFALTGEELELKDKNITE